MAFTAMISWGFYSAIIKKIGEWDYPTAAVTRRIYFYGMLFLIPVLMWQGVSWDVTVFKKPEIILNFLFLEVGASALGFFLWNLFCQMDRCDQDECIYLCVTGCDGCAICGDTA